MSLTKGLATLLFLSIGASLYASSTDKPIYLGTWKIVSGTPAPWADKDRVPSVEESRDLTGKILVFEAKRMTGPRQVSCSKPKFEMKEFAVDMLFQGQFAEMKVRDSSVNITDAAAKAGFTGAAEWQTLETGCETQVDFHFLNSKTAVFGLNNVIYTLKKQ